MLIHVNVEPCEANIRQTETMNFVFDDIDDIIHVEPDVAKMYELHGIYELHKLKTHKNTQQIY